MHLARPIPGGDIEYRTPARQITRTLLKLMRVMIRHGARPTTIKS